MKIRSKMGSKHENPANICKNAINNHAINNHQMTIRVSPQFSWLWVSNFVSNKFNSSTNVILFVPYRQTLEEQLHPVIRFEIYRQSQYTYGCHSARSPEQNIIKNLHEWLRDFGDDVIIIVIFNFAFNRMIDRSQNAYRLQARVARSGSLF